MTILVVCLYAVVGLGIAIAPEALLAAAAKEGAIEQVSHVVLALGIVAWATRARLRPRWPAVTAAALLAITLAEELDWGAELGLAAIASALDDRVGAPNLHNAAHGAAYALFAVPWALWAALPWAPERWRAAVEPHVPSRATSRALGIVALASGLALLAAQPWERALDEVNEAILYMALLGAALR
jgi:hypothetical protein